MKRKVLNILILCLILTAFSASSGIAALKYFRAQHWIVGTVDNAVDLTSAEGRTVILYNPSDPGNYYESTIGITGPSGNSNTYILNAFGIPSNMFTWEAGTTLEARVPIAGDTYGAGPVTVETTGGGFDPAPIMTIESVGIAPQIFEVRFDDTPYVSFSEANLVKSRPQISADIFTSDVFAYFGSVEVYVDNVAKYSGTDESWWAETNSVTFEYSFTEDLEYGSRIIRLKAISNSGTYAEKIMTVTVGGSGNVEVIGQTLAYPAPFKPLSGEIAILAYNLTSDADITLLMYDVSGEIIWTRKFKAGMDGGRVGYNGIMFDGKTDFKTIVPNGIYVFRIVSGKKVLSTGKLIVHD